MLVIMVCLSQLGSQSEQLRLVMSFMQLDVALSSIEDFYRRIYWQASTAATVYMPGYTLSYSGIAWMHSLNQLWLHTLDALDDHILVEAADFFGRYQAEYSLVFTEPDHPQKAAWLADRHYVERASSPIYALHGIPRPHHANREAKITPVQAEQQDDLLSVLYNTFFMGPELGHSVVRPEHFSDPTIRHYLAYVDGEAAACVTLLLKDAIAGVWNVGTLRNFRRQGLASAILMHALVEAAAAGYSDSVLLASPMGRSLYEEMGYHLIGITYYYGPVD